MKIRLALLLIAIAAPAAAQLGLPVGGVGPAVGGVIDTAGRAIAPWESGIDRVAQSAVRLAGTRLSRLSELVRRNRDAIELDALGDPARRGELLLMGASDADLNSARAAGFTVLGQEVLGALDITVMRLAPPDRMPLGRAEAALKELLPGAEVSADTLHFQSGASVAGGGPSPPNPAPAAIAVPVGMIDGAPAPSVAVASRRGFARGALTPSDHGSAIASILRLSGVLRIAVADVYGTDPAGGNALAIARGLDWLTGQGSRVVTISLVGPRNPLLARAIATAQQRGVHIVAAVGNDGPAAPPSYPASYPGVIAVTGVDGKGRALIEAGRASHLDYAAPGADLLAADAAGKWRRVRGTSYAAPFVAARAAAAAERGPVIPVLDREAIDLGRQGPDSVFGRGLLCRACAKKR